MSQPQSCFTIFIGKSKRRFQNLFNYLFDKSPSEIYEILERMNPAQLMRFLNFLNFTVLHDTDLEFEQERLNCFQRILMVCPRQIITELLNSICHQCRVSILERSNFIWVQYFLELLELGMNLEIYQNLHVIGQSSFGPDFVWELILFLSREIYNEELNHDLRQRIFVFILRNPFILSHIVQQSQVESDENTLRWVQETSERNGFIVQFNWFGEQSGPQHQAVDAEDFVYKTFPSIHPLSPSREYKCGMCHLTSDETNDDGKMIVFREFLCCHQPACNGCMVRCAEMCNTPEQEQQSKNTLIFRCPFCRTEKPLFPPKS